MTNYELANLGRALFGAPSRASATTHDLEQRIHHALDTITTAWQRNTSTIRSARPTIGTSQRRPNEHAPTPTHILDARHHAAQTLYGWCAVLVGDRGLNHAAVHLADVPGMARLLHTHARWLTGHEAANDLTDELEHAAHQLDNATTPNERRTWRIGVCPGIDQPDCGGTVTATARRDGTWTARCNTCGATGDLDQWRNALPLPDLVTIRGLATHLLGDGLNISEATIQGLIDRGKITVEGHDPTGRRLLNRAQATHAIKNRRTYRTRHDTPTETPSGTPAHT